jgi:hypothetical protein
MGWKLVVKLSEKQRGILERIERAFAPVRSPDYITNHRCWECDDVTRTFLGKKWHDYLYRPYELLGYFAPREPTIKVSRDCFPLLTRGAFHYFLPVFLAAMVIDSREADVMIDSMPGQFDPGPPRSPRGDRKRWELKCEQCEDLIRLMSEDQREAVACALEFFGPDTDRIPPTRQDAIENLRAGAVIAWRRHGSA